MISRFGTLVRQLFDVGGSFRAKVLRGTVWVFSSQAAQQVMSLARSIILARLLAPSDFGVMSLVFVSISALTIFTEMGIPQALVQSQDLDDDLLHTAWILSLARGALLSLVIFASAPLAAEFFRTPLLTSIMRVMALVQMLNGLNSLGPALLQRSLDFRALAYFTLGYEFVGLVAATLAAILLRSVWAIVIGAIASAIAAVVLSYFLHPYRPRLRFTRRSAGQLVHFGKHLTGASIVGYLCNMGDNAYIGRVLGTEAVGFYDLAYRLGNLPANSITSVFSRVTFPAFSSIQADLDRTRRLYLRGLHYVALVAVPACGAMLALAPFVVGVLYGSKWMPAVPAFMLLCVFGLERAVDSVSGQVILAQGRPDIGFKLALLKLTVMALGIVPLTARYGFVGTALAVTLSAGAIQIAVIPTVARVLALPIRLILKQVVFPCLGTLFMVATIALLRYVFEWPMSLASLFVLAGVGGSAYLGFVMIAERDLLYGVRSVLAARPVPGNPTTKKSLPE